MQRTRSQQNMVFRFWSAAAPRRLTIFWLHSRDCMEPKSDTLCFSDDEWGDEIRKPTRALLPINEQLFLVFGTKSSSIIFSTLISWLIKGLSYLNGKPYLPAFMIGKQCDGHFSSLVIPKSVKREIRTWVAKRSASGYWIHHTPKRK